MVERSPRGILCLAVLMAVAGGSTVLAKRAFAGDLPIVVGVSIPPQAYLVERLGGERVDVHVMVPPGASPAAYEPSPQQLVALGRSSLYVEVGHPNFLFEQRHLVRLLEANPRLSLVDMSAVSSPSCQGGQDQRLDADPHIWLSPRRMSALASAVEAAMASLDPEGAPRYRQNLKQLQEDIDQLDRELRKLLVVLQGRRFLVFHPAWSHFACEYGLQEMAIEAGGKEPGPAQLVGLIEEARREGARVIFVQTGFSDRSARVIATEIGARVETLDPLAHDWLENLRYSAGRIAAAIR